MSNEKNVCSAKVLAFVMLNSDYETSHKVADLNGYFKSQ